MTSLATGAAFVGRAGELDALMRALDEAIAGRSRMFLLTGEPGIGKTRLCDEVTALGGARGVPVLWGRAWEAGGAPAYWPWLDVLGGLTRLLDDGALTDVLGDGAVLLAELVPELRARAIPLPDVARPPPDEARFRLCRTVVALVRRVAATAGLVLVFDDLHSADQSSLLLLYALGRELRPARVLLLCTCRDVEARLVPEASELIGRLAREGTTLRLARLDRTAVGHLRVRHTQKPQLLVCVPASAEHTSDGEALGLSGRHFQSRHSVTLPWPWFPLRRLARGAEHH